MSRVDICFGEELRRWRTLRGRTQSEVAARAGYSQRHLSFLELGRSRPTRESVMVLSETLGVPLHDRNRLLLSAGFAPCYSEHPISSEELSAAVGALRSLLESSRPFPAMLVDRAWNIYAVNRNMEALLQYFIRKPELLAAPDRVNALDLCMAEDGLRGAIINWQEFGRAFTNLIRRDLTYDPRNDQLRTLLDRLERDPALASSGASNEGDRREPVSVLKLRKNDVTMRLFTIVSSLDQPNDTTLSNLRAETFFPFDVATRARLNGFEADLRGTA